VSTPTVPGYRLGAMLAAGRRGPVHRAVREADGTVVTIHLVEATLDRAQRRRFRAETAGLLRLPPSAHLVPLLDAGVTAGGQPYLVTPLAEGTLADRLATARLDVARVIRAGLDAAAGLGDLHRTGMLHGNLAPGNLVELHGGAVALTGFALPVLEELDGAVPGSYGPPEVLEGGDWTVAADLYALAGTLFALLTGAPPYERRDAADLLARMRSGAVPEIDDDRVPDRLRAALRRGLDPNPRARFSSAGELATELNRVLQAADPGSDPHPSGLAAPAPAASSRVETVPPQPDQAPSGRQFGSRYLVGDQIGEGSMGVVCRAVDTDDGQPVAIKLLKPPFTTDDGAVTRFLREGSALRRVAHPNLVRVRDFVAESGNFGLVMDLVEGQDLRTVMATQPLTPAQACAVLGQVAGALGAVHAGGIVHRDVKPENVLVERDDGCNARLADFGIARFAEGPTLTQPGMILCTLAYAAPEMRSGAQASKRSDVYALGVVAYELFAGSRPGSGGNPLAPSPAPSKPAAMPDELWHLVRDCLDGEPVRRPEAAALAPSLMAISRALGGLPPLPRWGSGRASSVRTPILASAQPQTPVPVGARPESTGSADGERVSTAASERPPPAPPVPDTAPTPRRRVLLVAAAVILIGSVAGVAVALLGNRQQDPVATDTAARTAYHQVPVAARASSPGSRRVRLTFSGGGSDVVGYLIYRLGPDGEAVGGGDGELLDTGPLPGPSYEIRGAEAGVRHCFRVTALLAGAPSPPPERRASPNATCVKADGGPSSKADKR
jgi:serine/threonine protein kinase